MTDPTKAIARYDGPKSIDELARYSQLLAGGNGSPRNETLPIAFRGNPAALAFAVEYAKALDVSPITALTGIHVVDGKPTASAGLISALIRRAGHRLRVWTEGSIEDGSISAVATVIRGDDDDGFEYRSVWTLDRAVRAGLMTKTPDGRFVGAKPKSAWSTYPENMLKARAITEVGRDAAEDALLGVHYTPEELGVEVDDAGDPVITVTRLPDPEPPPPPPPPSPPSDSLPPEKTGPEKGTQPPDAPGVRVAGLSADQWRTEILSMETIEDLSKLWEEAAPDQSVRLGALKCGDEDGVETTVLDLFVAQGAAIRGGAPLRDRYAKLEATVVELTKPPPEVAETIDAAISEDPPADDAKAMLDALVDRLSPSEVEALIAWGKRHGLSMAGEVNLARLTLAASTLILHRPEPLDGELPITGEVAVAPEQIDEWLTRRNLNPPDDAQAVALVRDRLGGTVIESHTLTAEERKAAAEATAEDRELEEKARTAVPKPAKPERVKARAAEARKAIREGKETQ